MVEASELSIYPNPLTLVGGDSKLHVSIAVAARAAIYSIEGKLLVSDIQLAEGNNDLTIPPLASGLYFLTFNNVAGERIAVKQLTVRR
jgi:hypothetical protein